MVEYYTDIQGKDYRLLIELASQKCDKFAFVIRKDMMYDEELAMKHYNELLKDIKSSLIEVKEQSEWEVNSLLEATAYVYYYEFNEQTKQFLHTKSNSLFGWMNGLPEDLMFYNGDKIWLACNSHEGYFFINEVEEQSKVTEILKKL